MQNRGITKAGRERIKPILPACSALLLPARVALEFSSEGRRTERELPEPLVYRPKAKDSSRRWLSSFGHHHRRSSA